MATTKTLGGDRLGSGKKMKVTLHGFERSTHDLGYVWRNTQAPGTLVPFMNLLALPADDFKIELQADVKTHPTIGPLFASFKLQLDVFQCPIRLYHAWLHNNKLKIGMNMSSVKLPQLDVSCNPLRWTNAEIEKEPLEMQQINPSSLLSYLGVRGTGQIPNSPIDGVRKNAIPTLAYWDIYKNYYANKQEEIGMYIHTSPEQKDFTFAIYAVGRATQIVGGSGTNLWSVRDWVNDHTVQGTGYPLDFRVHKKYFNEKEEIDYFINYLYGINDSIQWGTRTEKGTLALADGVVDGDYYNFTTETYYKPDSFMEPNDITLTGITIVDNPSLIDQQKQIKVEAFELTNIDEMRDAILGNNVPEAPFVIHEAAKAPYGPPLMNLTAYDSTGQLCSYMPQEGLALKTYQSDIFNNWLNTEWIEGDGGINDITAVDTSGGSFDINTLNLAQKVYDMLNRIAVSGGTYDDWMEAVYDHDGIRKAETPMYMGGLSKEIVFQEVVSTAAASLESGQQDLGTLAGRGILSNKHKGGYIEIKVSEPSFIIGIVSITPRIDYYQGNDWTTRLKTMDDLHKPNLDEIGFQDLITDEMAFWDTQINELSEEIYRSAGKQPAWLNYMTNFNKLYGNFADERSEMFMTLARRYEPMDEKDLTKSIKDLTSYIDPTKFNYAFAQTDITAMNFWVQIASDVQARRKMSAKLMPNL